MRITEADRLALDTLVETTGWSTSEVVRRAVDVWCGVVGEVLDGADERVEQHGRRVNALLYPVQVEQLAAVAARRGSSLGAEARQAVEALVRTLRAAA